MSAALEPVLSLEPMEHIYRLGDRVLPSVTEILKGAGLVDDTWFTEFGRLRGSAVHMLCHYDNENDLNESTVDRALRGYLEAHRRFKRETGFVPEVSEEMVCNEAMGYAGTLDERGTVNGKPWLVDIKSGAVTTVVRYQLAGYLGCFPKPYLWTRVAVGLTALGTYSLKVYGPETWRRDWATWGSICDMYHLRKELGLI